MEKETFMRLTRIEKKKKKRKKETKKKENEKRLKGERKEIERYTR